MEKELIEEAKNCSSAQEIQDLAAEHGYEITAEQAEEYLERLSSSNGEISDEELDNISGGGCSSGGAHICSSCNVTMVKVDGEYRCPQCGKKSGSRSEY